MKYDKTKVDQHKAADNRISGRWCCMCGHCRVARKEETGSVDPKPRIE